VGIAAGSLYAQRREGPVGGDATIVGVAEHDPTWIIVAQAPPGAARVRATFPDGTHDEMTPVDGVAVLSRPAASTTGTITVEAFDGSGTPLGSAPITAPGSSARIDPAQCNAPQQLPPPGPTQPADPASARTTINNLVVSAFSDRSLSDAQVFALYDDSHGFADVLKQLRSSSFKNEVAAARVSKLDGLVFLSATKAALEFTINIPNYSSFSQRFGEAVLTDGTWKLTRATFCNQVSLAGVQCPP
ncbi:MAG TPA: hypothetical protein VN636_06200, partial [Acidimicrobiia bacterium]|nr:hypothetical protein [Acidimicrobiia bacterium]